MITLTRRYELPDLIAYAGATWDWHRLHYDPAYLASVGLDAPVVDGQALGALLAEVLTDHLGPGWRLASLDYRFGSLVLAGETVRAEASITGRDAERVTADLRVVVVDADGTELRAAVTRGSAELVPRVTAPAAAPAEVAS